jgi:predicted ATP-grasp superfamily ATP-dependent carboligase
MTTYMLKIKMNKSVLVTDARCKATLSIVRSLGKKGISAYCATDKSAPDGYCDSNSLNAISYYSRYVKKCFYYPNPSNQEGFEESIKKICRKHDLKVIIPSAQRPAVALSKAKERIKPLITPISDYRSLSVAESKKKTILLAKELNIPTPKTTFLKSFSDLKNFDFKFPLVVKGVYGAGQIFYVQDMQELKKAVFDLNQRQGEYPLIQEYVQGEGYGFFALLNQGSPRAIFMHKRIREYPATGGMSTCAKSVYEPKLLEYGLKLLKKLQWHGVAMVEFKKDVHDGEFKLMEINPRFWGSLDLSIAAGVDFPHLLYKMALEGDIEPKFSYRNGLKFSWVFPLDFVRVFKDKSAHRRIEPFLSDFIDPRVQKNIHTKDLNPCIMQFAVSLKHVYDMWYIRARKK